MKILLYIGGILGLMLICSGYIISYLVNDYLESLSNARFVTDATFDDLLPEPLIIPIDGGQIIDTGDILIQPEAKFRVDALLIRSRDYKTKRWAEMITREYRIGWGPMTIPDNAVDYILSAEAQSNRHILTQHEHDQFTTVLYFVPVNNEIKQKIERLETGHYFSATGTIAHISKGIGMQFSAEKFRGFARVYFIEELKQL